MGGCKKDMVQVDHHLPGGVGAEFIYFSVPRVQSLESLIEPQRRISLFFGGKGFMF